MKKAGLLFLISFLTQISFSQSIEDLNQRLGKGVNYGNMFEAPTEGGWGQYWKEDYANIITELGFNHVRIPIRWEPTDRSMSEAPYTIYPVFFDRIKEVVDNALANDLMAIIDLHHHEALYENPAENKARFLAQWEQIANEFKDYSDSLYFEVLNEPHGNMSAEIWNEYLAEAVEIIRKDNPNRAVLIGTAEYGGLGGLPKLVLPEDNHLILTVHYYNPFQFTHQGAGWVGEQSNEWLGTKWLNTDDEIAVMEKEFSVLKEYSATHEVPVHIGEFGAYEKADIASRVRWTTYLTRYFESQNWSWAYWDFSAGFGFYNEKTGTLNKDMVNALLHNE